MLVQSYHHITASCDLIPLMGQTKEVGIWSDRGTYKSYTAPMTKPQPNRVLELILGLTLFYMGFWRYVITLGGSKRSPPIKISQNDSNLVKRHVLAKIDHCCPLFMHLELNHYHF